MNDSGTEQDDELSLKDFKTQMEQLRLFVRSLVHIALRYTRKYYLLIILLAFGVAGLGYYEYKTSKVYESKASFVYIDLQKKTFGEMIDKLQEMIVAGSYNRVAESLAIPPGQARSIIDIKAENVNGSKLSEDITENRKIFYVNVIATDKKLFDSLEYAIEHYLNNNVMVKEVVARQKKILTEKIAYEKQDLAQLDSLKVAYTKSLNQPSSSMYPTGASQFNPVQLYERGEKIIHDITSMQALIDDYRVVKTQDRFMITENPVGKSIPTFFVKYFAIFIAGCIGLFFLLSIFRK